MTTRKARVLVVDDEPIVRMILADTLAEADYEIFEAGSGIAAKAMLDEIGAVDLVVTDVNMPRCDGFQVANHARLGQPSLPILFVTGVPDQVGFHAMTEPWRMLVKPFALSMLLEAVARILAVRS